MNVKLNRLTWTGIVMLELFVLGFLFDLIAYGTEGWCNFSRNGVLTNLGLWNGCFKDVTTGKRVCSSKIFESEEFHTGSEWLVGARVLMTLLLVFQLFQLIALICYIFVYQLVPYRGKMTVLNIGLTMLIGSMTFLLLLLYGIEAEKLPGGTLGWAFILLVLSFIFQIIIGALVYFHYRRATTTTTSTMNITSQSSSMAIITRSSSNASLGIRNCNSSLAIRSGNNSLEIMSSNNSPGVRNSNNSLGIISSNSSQGIKEITV